MEARLATLSCQASTLQAEPKKPKPVGVVVDGVSVCGGGLIRGERRGEKTSLLVGRLDWSLMEVV